MQESMGPIYDRRNEHLASADLAIIHARRKWLRLAGSMENDEKPESLPGVDCPEDYMVRSASVMLGQDESWLDGAAAWLEARPGSFMKSV